MKISNGSRTVIAMMMISAAVFAGLAFNFAALGHAPSSVSASYDFDKQELTVTISHSVTNANTHYIQDVKIYRNSVLNRTVTYTSQPTTNTFSYKYNISAKDGEYLNATATCNLGGSGTGSVKVKEPKLPMKISYSPSPRSMDENSVVTFEINLTSDGKSVAGASLTLTPTHGSAGAPSEVSDGNFTFDYTAPEVDTDTDVKINVSAIGTGYEDAYLDIGFRVRDTTPPPPGQIYIEIDPELEEIDEETTVSFIMRVMEGSDLLSGADIVVSSDLGTISNYIDNMDGTASFNYTAPDIEIDTDDVLRMKANRSGYVPGYLNHTIAVKAEISGPSPTLDGIVSEGEYPHMQVLSEDEFVLYWNVSDDMIHLAIMGKGTGWISLGLNSSEGMKDADMLFGWVSGSDVMVFDMYSTGVYGPHPPDTNLGGTYDIMEFGGTEEDGWTTLEFVRLLDTGDAYDFAIPDGVSVPVIWGIGSSDAVDSAHTSRGSAHVVFIPDETDPRWIEDGVISDGEYDASKEFDGKFTLHWKVDADEIKMGMSAGTSGWISVGFEPTNVMLDADMVFGWVSGGIPSVLDAYSTGVFGPHPPDTTLGGTDDILTYGGTGSSEGTVIEFSRKLATGDPYDKEIMLDSELSIIWAMGADDDFTSMHIHSGSGSIFIGDEPPVNETDPREVLDGIVNEDEYDFSTSFMGGQMNVHWSVKDGNLSIALDGNTTGWVSIGFEPTMGMKDADMLIGWVKDGRAHVVDAFSTGMYGPHPPDTTLGGEDDILAFGGTEADGRTVIEFVRRLVTEDEYDFDFPTDGNVSVIWALGPDDEFSSEHVLRGSGILSMWEEPHTPPVDPRRTLDGIVSDGEYAFSAEYSSGDMKLYWKLSGDDIHLAMMAKASGWVSIGFKPTVGMKDADMVFGWVVGDDLFMVDAFSTGETGPHPPDTQLGGTDDLISYGGSESGGWTTIEFVRKQSTGDLYDRDLMPDEVVPIIWGFSDTDEFTAMHTNRGSGSIRLGEEPTTGPEPTLDGIVSEGEYDNMLSFDDGNHLLYWSYEGEKVKMAMKAKTTGWVAVGFSPTMRMKDADMIIGWVDENGDVHMIDAFSTGETGPHPPDASLGGTYDILEFGGSEAGGWTTIEFVRNKVTPDAYDREIKDDITIIWAYGSQDDPASAHSARGSGTLSVASGEDDEEEEGFPFILIAIILLVIAVIAIIAVIAMRKGSKNGIPSSEE